MLWEFFALCFIIAESDKRHREYLISMEQLLFEQLTSSKSLGFKDIWGHFKDVLEGTSLFIF